MERQHAADLRQERLHYLDLVRRAKEAFRRGSPELRSDFYAACTAVALDSGSLRYASKELQNHRDLVLRAVAASPSALQYASAELRADRDLLWQTLNARQSPLRHASAELWGDKALVLRAVRRNGYALKHASALLQDDPDVVLEAAKSDGEALVYASRQLRGCKAIVLEAVSNMGLALEYASLELQNDREIVLAATRNFGGALEYASDELQAQKEIVLEAVKSDVYAFNFASSGLHGDPEVVLEVTKSDSEGLALLAASEEIRADREILLVAARQHRAVLSHYEEIAPAALKQTLTVEALQQAVDSYLAAPGEAAPVLSTRLCLEQLPDEASETDGDVGISSGTATANDSSSYSSCTSSNNNNKTAATGTTLPLAHPLIRRHSQRIRCDARLMSGDVLTIWLEPGDKHAPRPRPLEASQPGHEQLQLEPRPRDDGQTPGGGPSPLSSSRLDSDDQPPSCGRPALDSGDDEDRRGSTSSLPPAKRPRLAGSGGGGGNEKGSERTTNSSSNNSNSSNSNSSNSNKNSNERLERTASALFWEDAATMNDLARLLSEKLEARAPACQRRGQRVFILLEQDLEKRPGNVQPGQRGDMELTRTCRREGTSDQFSHDGPTVFGELEKGTDPDKEGSQADPHLGASSDADARSGDEDVPTQVPISPFDWARPLSDFLLH